MVARGPVKACGLSLPFWNRGSVSLVRGKPTSRGLITSSRYLAPLVGLGPLCSCSQTHPSLSQATLFYRKGVPPLILDQSPFRMVFPTAL